MIGLKLAWLSIWLIDENDNDLTATGDFGADWDSDLEEGCLYSRERLAPVREARCIALDPLNRAAGRALQETGRFLGVSEQ